MSINFLQVEEAPTLQENFLNLIFVQTNKAGVGVGSVFLHSQKYIYISCMLVWVAIFNLQFFYYEYYDLYAL